MFERRPARAFRLGLGLLTVGLGLSLGWIGLGCQPESSQPSLAEHAQAIGEAVCRPAFSCDCDNESTDRFADEAACVEGVSALILDRASDDVGLTFNPDCVQTIVDALAAFGCEPVDLAGVDPSLFGPVAQLRECRLFTGMGAVGSSCVRLDGGLGDDCDLRSACDVQSNTCVAIGTGAFEDVCESDGDCQAAFRCRMSSQDMRMRCLEAPGPGEPCSMSMDCGADAYCNAAGSCVAIPTAGQSCASMPSVGGYTCSPGTDCANGICETGSLEGEACGITCGEGLACEGGFCRALDAVVCRYVVDAL